MIVMSLFGLQYGELTHFFSFNCSRFQSRHPKYHSAFFLLVREVDQDSTWGPSLLFCLLGSGWLCIPRSVLFLIFGLFEQLWNFFLFLAKTFHVNSFLFKGGTHKHMLNMNTSKQGWVRNFFQEKQFFPKTFFQCQMFEFFGSVFVGGVLVAQKQITKNKSVWLLNFTYHLRTFRKGGQFGIWIS